MPTKFSLCVVKFCIHFIHSPFASREGAWQHCLWQSEFFCDGWTERYRGVPLLHWKLRSITATFAPACAHKNPICVPASRPHGTNALFCSSSSSTSAVRCKGKQVFYGKRRTVHEWFSTTCACYTDGNIWILLFGCLRPNERMVLQRVLLPWVKARRSAGRGGFRVEPTNVEHVFDVSEALPVPGGFSFFTKNHLITLPCLLKPRLQLVELETFVPGCGVASNNYKTSNQYVFKFLLLFLSGPRFGDVFCLKLFFFFKPTCVIISPTEKEKLVHRVKRFVVRIFHLRMSFL